ncbi:thioredoxin [bacterium]|nr:thioredoxin [bacterium]MBU1938053.1 thioredoxin [bacterium]
MSTVTNATDATFESDVLKSDVLTVVDFWAPWCAPCRMISPILEEIAAENEGHLRLVKVNVDENPQSAVTYGIQAIPNLLFFKDGKVVDQAVGAVPKAVLAERIKGLLA